jgi:hypothetical protein
MLKLNNNNSRNVPSEVTISEPGGLRELSQHNQTSEPSNYWSSSCTPAVGRCNRRCNSMMKVICNLMGQGHCNLRILVTLGHHSLMGHCCTLMMMMGHYNLMMGCCNLMGHCNLMMGGCNLMKMGHCMMGHCNLTMMGHCN